MIDLSIITVFDAPFDLNDLIFNYLHYHEVEIIVK